jgi:pilus assembly protein TadC
MGFMKELADKYPELKRKLATVHVDTSPERYVARNLQASLLVTFILSFGAFLFLSGMEAPIWLVLLIAPMMFFVVFALLMRSVDVQIRKFAKEIDQDVLFAGRFLLVKLNSGRPLMNAIIDASNSYGVASKYFKEIVRDIELGTPLEQALEKASRYCPSDKMRRILFQISNALKIGVDVTNYLEAILDEIAQDQLTEIKKYGRKLSSITMFYMLFAVVIPSLGITMFITVVSIVSIPIDAGLFVMFLFLLVVVELMFISLFKSIRPTVNI